MDVQLRFYVRDARGRGFASGDPRGPLMQAHAGSLARWAAMVRFARGLNWVFNLGPRRSSLYDLSMLNPLNVLPLRWLATLFGVSAACWEDIVVPMYFSTFLSSKLDLVPAVILPIVSDIIPLTEPAILKSWQVVLISAPAAIRIR